MVEGTHVYAALVVAAAAIDAGRPGPFIAGAYAVALAPLLPWAARRLWAARQRSAPVQVLAAGRRAYQVWLHVAAELTRERTLGWPASWATPCGDS